MHTNTKTKQYKAKSGQRAEGVGKEGGRKAGGRGHGQCKWAEARAGAGARAEAGAGAAAGADAGAGARSKAEAKVGAGAWGRGKGKVGARVNQQGERQSTRNMEEAWAGGNRGGAWARAGAKAEATNNSHVQLELCNVTQHSAIPNNSVICLLGF